MPASVTVTFVVVAVAVAESFPHSFSPTSSPSQVALSVAFSSLATHLVGLFMFHIKKKSDAKEAVDSTAGSFRV